MIDLAHAIGVDDGPINGEAVLGEFRHVMHEDACHLHFLPGSRNVD